MACDGPIARVTSAVMQPAWKRILRALAVVYVTLTDNWVELAARFVIPVREARTIKDQMARAIRERFDAEGLRIASTSMDVTIVSR